MAHSKKSHIRRTGHIPGPSGPHVPNRPLHSVEVLPTTAPDASLWGRRRVLLLNSTYEPLTALPLRRAVIMVMCGKADVVHDDPAGPVIHSATRTIVVPSVIRLRTMGRYSISRPAWMVM